MQRCNNNFILWSGLQADGYDESCTAESCKYLQNIAKVNFNFRVYYFINIYFIFLCSFYLVLFYSNLFFVYFIFISIYFQFYWALYMYYTYFLKNI